MEVAGPSREACASLKLNRAESLVRAVVTRVDEFKKNAEKLHDAVKYLKQNVERKDCQQEFVSESDVIKSSRELVCLGEKMKDITVKNVAKLQVYADRMIQVISFANRINDSNKEAMEIERDETGKKFTKKTDKRNEYNGREFRSMKEIATSRINDETTDSSEDEVSSRKIGHSHIPKPEASHLIGKFGSKKKLARSRVKDETIYVNDDNFSSEKVFYSLIRGPQTSHLNRKHATKHAEVSENTSVEKADVCKQAKFKSHSSLMEVGGKSEFPSSGRVSRRNESCENEDTELVIEKNRSRSIDLATSKTRHSEVTTPMKERDEFPSQEWGVKFTRKRTLLNRNDHPDEACTLVREIGEIKNVCGDMANISDEKTSKKRPATDDTESRKNKILVLDKNFKMPVQNEVAAQRNNETFSVLEHADLSFSSPVSGSRSDSSKQKQKCVKNRYTDTSARRWCSIPEYPNSSSNSSKQKQKCVKDKYTDTSARRWHSIPEHPNSSNEHFGREIKSRRQTSETRNNGRPTTEIRLIEVDKLPGACRSASDKPITDELKMRNNKSAKMVHKRRIRKTECEKEESSDDSSDDDYYLHGSKGTYLNARDASKERCRRPNLSENFGKLYRSMTGSGSAISENQGLIKSAEESDFAKQNICTTSSSELMGEEKNLPPEQQETLQNRKIRQRKHNRAEADELMFVEENVFVNYTSNTRATTSRCEENRESASHDRSPKVMENSSSDESRDSPIIETVDFPDIYTSWHRILEHFIEIQSQNSTYMGHLESVFEHVSDIYGILDEDSSEDQPHGLSEEEINDLPVSEYSKHYKKNTERWGKDTKCSICLSQYVYGELLRNLPCLHDFHAHCVDKWLERSNTCPTCRRVV